MPRPRKPHKLHAIDGTARPDRHGPEAIHADPAQPGDLVAPGWLTARAARIFDEVVERLLPLQLLTTADRDAVAHYAVVMDQIQTAPHLATASMHAQARNLRSDLAMTPIARTRAKPAEGKAKPGNPFEAIR